MQTATQNTDQTAVMSANKTAFLSCLERADARTEPYAHWLLEDALDGPTCDAIRALPVKAPEIGHYDGTREHNNDTRIYFNAETGARHPVIADVAATFKDPDVIARLEQVCNTDLSNGSLRIEYTLDTDGFWLEPHTDISVKLFTMLIYLSEEPELADAGTDIYDNDLKHVGRSPYGPNEGLIFIPGKDTWHGFIKRPVRGVRRSLIVNYVSPEWRAKEELA